MRMQTVVVAGVLAVVAGVVVVAAQDRGPGRRGRGGFTSPLVMTIDTNQDGTISAAELAAAPAALEALDTNGDGQLTGQELRPAFGRGGREGGRQGFGFEGRRGGRGDDEGPAEAPAASADDLTATLMAFDGNGDGKLDHSEVPTRFQGLFDRADANGDGVLTADELRQSATAQTQPAAGGRGRGEGDGGEREGRGFGRGGFGLDRVLAALDTNQDGTLSAAELAAAPDHLKTLDQNSDGQLTPDELRPAFGRGRAEGPAPDGGQ